MKIAISNIAWRPAEDEAVAGLLKEFGVDAIEVAPTTVWGRPLEVTSAEAAAYRSWWEERGIHIVAFQSLLYGRPDLVLFGAPEKRAETLDYLRSVFRLASWLGAGPLVFGSPRNRKAGAMPPAEIIPLAKAFFLAAGQSAAQHGVVLCLEPNPREYECDFVNSAAEGRVLVEGVASSGFGLHLDAAAMTLAGDAPAAIAAGTRPLHFHISEPYLAPLGAGGVDHGAFAAALRGSSYNGWCSIEMRPPAEGSALDLVARALELAVSVYG